MPTSKLPAELIATGEGAFWLAYIWAIVYTAETGHYMPTAVASAVACLAVAIYFLNRCVHVHLGRFPVRARRTQMMMHLIWPSMILAPATWAVLENTLDHMPEAMTKMLLVGVLSTIGLAVYATTCLARCAFQNSPRFH